MSIKGFLTAAATSALLMGAGAALADPTTPENKAAWPADTATQAAPLDSATATDAATVPPSADVTVTVAAQTPTMTLEIVSNKPVADTPENRARYGGPMSNAGRRTRPAGN
jgi:hypothetical protein